MTAQHDLQSCLSAPLEAHAVLLSQFCNFEGTDLLALLANCRWWSESGFEKIRRSALTQTRKVCALWCKHLRPQHELENIFCQTRPQPKTLRGGGSVRENLYQPGIWPRPRKSPRALGDKFEEFFDYAICVAKNGNTKRAKNIFAFLLSKGKRSGLSWI